MYREKLLYAIISKKTKLINDIIYLNYVVSGREGVHEIKYKYSFLTLIVL